MSLRIPKYIMIDSCYWFALYNSSDSYHTKAMKLFPTIEPAVIIIPWPSLYEVLNTRFLSHPIAMQEFELILSRPNTKYIVDKPYRQKALSESINSSKRRKRYISLVDSVIRNMILNVNIRVDAMVSYNVGDFSDVCQRRKIPILF